MKKSANKNERLSANSDRILDVDHIKPDLKERTVRGGAVTIIAQIIKQALSICSIVILARLLTPHDFGLIAMVTAVTGFALVFKDMGLSMATVQRAEIDNEQISTLFWINVAFSLFIFALTSGLAPVIAWYYKEPKLIWITISLSVGFIFGGLTVQHQAILKRQMRFISLTFIEIASSILGIGVGIGLSLVGASYWALVLMQLTIALSSAVGTWMLCPWHPGRPVRIGKVRSMLIFGSNLTGFNIINYFARNIDNFLIGRYFGAQQLALYSKAYALLLLPISQINTPISNVLIPALSRLQSEPDRFRRAYLKAISTIGFFTMPVAAFLLLNSKEVILLVLGQQWIGAAKIFQVLAIASFLQPIANTTGWLFISMGRTRDMLKWRLATCWFGPIAYAIGLYFYGTIGVAYGHVFASLVLTIPVIWYAQKGTGIGTLRILKAILQPFVLAFTVNITLFYIIFDKIHVIFSALLMMMLYIALNLLFDRSLNQIKEVLNILLSFKVKPERTG
jgi:PST family polysaccharide transporter